jgi:heat-inducible transcriptional repressor
VEKPSLSPRQAAVLRALVGAYLGEASPIGSLTLSHILAEKLSAASVRNTLAELAELELVEKPHASAGRVPTGLGLRLFVDEFLRPQGLTAYERRSIDRGVAGAAPEALPTVASQLLSERTHQLGFVVTPRLDRLVLRHLTLVRLSRERLLVVLVSQNGQAYHRMVEDQELQAPAEIERAAALLNERAVGRTLREVRDRLEREAERLRSEADALLRRVLELGARALAPDELDGTELVIATRLALLDQPEFQDPRRLRDLFEALETKERLLEILDRMLDAEGVRVAFGEEVDEPGLRHCALVAMRYGRCEEGEEPLGALGVIGPSRMDFGRVIPLVDYLSRALTDKLGA